MGYGSLKLRIGITGKPRIGKSTIVKAVIKRLKVDGIAAGGMLTSDISEGEQRVGFSIENINTGEKGILAHIRAQQKGPKVGRYVVNITDLEVLGYNAIKDAVTDSNIEFVIIDEIGPMELKSKRFIDAVEEAIASGKPMLVSVHQKSEHKLVKKVKKEFEMFVVTEANRDDMVNCVFGGLVG